VTIDLSDFGLASIGPGRASPCHQYHIQTCNLCNDFSISFNETLRVEEPGMRLHGSGALRGCCGVVKRTRYTPLAIALRNGTVNSENVHGTVQWARGVKRVTSVTVKTRPQGVILPKPGEDVLDPEPEPAYPTVIQQALNNMRKFSHCVVITRVGSFYEV
jgi:hypothetical protein